MSYISRVVDILTPDDPDLEDGSVEADSETDLERSPNIFDSSEPGEMERILRNTPHSRRLHWIREEPRLISRTKWREYDIHIRNDEEKRKLWGIGQNLTDAKEGILICESHEAAVNSQMITLGWQRSSSNSSQRSTSRNAEAGVNTGVRAGTSQTNSSTRSRSNTRGGSKHEQKQVLECATDIRDCKLNLRAFNKVGNLNFSFGSRNNDELESEVERVKREIGIKSNDSSDEEGDTASGS